MFYRIFVGTPLALLLCYVSFGFADETEELRRAVEDTKASVSDLQSRLADLESERSSSPAGRRALGPQVMNPEIGFVADIVAKSTQSDEDEEGNDRISVREIELVLGHDVDPYARLDATLTLSDFEEADIEEAYLTHWGLPGGLRMRLGRFRPKIGKATAVHGDQQDTVDFPLVVQEYLGAEGLFRSGLELSRIFPGASDRLTHELIAGVLEGGIGEEGTLFGETRRRPTLYAHLKNFWDMSTYSSLEVGGTWITGSSNEDDDFNTTALAADVTFLHRFDSTRRLKLQSEIYRQDRDEPAAGEEASAAEETIDEPIEEDIAFRDNPYGFYVLADQRVAQRWSCGARYDWVEPVNKDEGAGNQDRAYSAYFTFHESEFARWRIQYQHLDAANGEDDERVWLQLTAAIGVHKHQLQ